MTAFEMVIKLVFVKDVFSVASKVLESAVL
jgi:hypothetical protein